jgi:hypothetical protein
MTAQVLAGRRLVQAPAAPDKRRDAGAPRDARRPVRVKRTFIRLARPGGVMASQGATAS